MVQATEPQDELQPGQVFAGRYRIDTVLGEGDRKRTYLAEDVKVGDHLVALSIVKVHASTLDVEGTKREAWLLGRVSGHAHIVGFHDYDVDGPVQYLVFEYLPNGTLAELIERTTEAGGVVSQDAILRYGRQLAGALIHVHGKGVLHRDVAPHNVWLGSLDKAKLGDFDSAILLDDVPAHLPATSEDYASPEERHGGNLDQRSDLFSLGAVLISLARGELRFDEPERLGEQRPDLAPSLVELLASLVAPSPDERPESAIEVLGRMKQIDEKRDVHSVIASGEGPKVEFKASMRFPRGADALSTKLSPTEHQAAIERMYTVLEKMVLKTIAAFLNTEGGTLLIGVEDDGTIVGIEDDFTTFAAGKQNQDMWQLNLKQKLINFLGADTGSSLDIVLEPTSNGTVARLECSRRPHETWFADGKSEEFYVRIASSTESLSPSKAVAYIKEHWS